MRRRWRHWQFPALLFPLAFAAAPGWPAEGGGTDSPVQASTAFCLFELPAQGDFRTLINLGIVQYIELWPQEVRIYYGGGNLGSGHEARVSVSDADEGRAVIGRMRATAAQCAAK